MSVLLFQLHMTAVSFHVQTISPLPSFFQPTSLGLFFLSTVSVPQVYVPLLDICFVKLTGL